tara:strand:+ start:411 stop:737 length:327 start_codon:yes stop_codon:yes gene_type:complete
MALGMAGRGWSDGRIAEFLGVPTSTFATWRQRNHKGFATALARARLGMGDDIAKTVITAAMGGDMYAARYVLSKIFPDVWGDHVTADEEKAAPAKVEIVVTDRRVENE